MTIRSYCIATVLISTFLPHGATCDEIPIEFDTNFAHSVQAKEINPANGNILRTLVFDTTGSTTKIKFDLNKKSVLQQIRLIPKNGTNDASFGQIDVFVSAFIEQDRFLIFVGEHSFDPDIDINQESVEALYKTTPTSTMTPRRLMSYYQKLLPFMRNFIRQHREHPRRSPQFREVELMFRFLQASRELGWKFMLDPSNPDVRAVVAFLEDLPSKRGGVRAIKVARIGGSEQLGDVIDQINAVRDKLLIAIWSKRDSWPCEASEVGMRYFSFLERYYEFAKHYPSASIRAVEAVLAANRCAGALARALVEKLSDPSRSATREETEKVELILKERGEKSRAEAERLTGSRQVLKDIEYLETLAGDVKRNGRPTIRGQGVSEVELPISARSFPRMVSVKAEATAVARASTGCMEIRAEGLDRTCKSEQTVADQGSRLSTTMECTALLPAGSKSILVSAPNGSALNCTATDGENIRAELTINNFVE